MVSRTGKTMQMDLATPACKESQESKNRLSVRTLRG
jgi:hypothetical protein